MSSSGVSVHVQVTIAPENVGAYLELMKEVLKHVTAEPECTFFEVYQDPEKPGVLKWIENWSKGMDWLMTVSSQPKLKT
jgi:quinol monooxygenase YgiN